MESLREILQGGKMEIIAQLNHDLAIAKLNIETLLRLVGEFSRCPHCKYPIYYVRYARSGDREPHNCDGSPHRATCPSTEEVIRVHR